MTGKPGTLWINLGLLLLAAALFLAAYNQNTSNQAQRISEAVIEELEKPPVWTESQRTEPTEPTQDREMPVQIIDGLAYIGTLSIPSLELALPVLSQWNDANLKTAPCRYQGSVYDGSLIICAHNYASHFGKLKDLRVGDTACFTDMDDIVYRYTVVGQETLDATDIAGMEEGDWDLTLFTCTAGGQTRVTVRLEKQLPAEENLGVSPKSLKKLGKCDNMFL